MTIGLQGTWFVSVKSKSASWAQRFVIEGAKQHKARITLKNLLETVVLPRKVADVRLRIRGYDTSGDLVAGAEDEVMLHVDEMPATGDIASILVPGETDFTGCALIELPSDTSPLEVKLRAVDIDGYLNSWSLSAVKGSNVTVGLTDTATSAAPGGAYPARLSTSCMSGHQNGCPPAPIPTGTSLSA